jgi:hypothetical protein
VWNTLLCQVECVASMLMMDSKLSLGLFGHNGGCGIGTNTYPIYVYVTIFCLTMKVIVSIIGIEKVSLNCVCL